MEEKMKVLSPIRWSVWIALKEYALKRTKEERKKITLQEIIEEAIMDLASRGLNPKNKNINK